MAWRLDKFRGESDGGNGFLSGNQKREYQKT
jgi:hypothetical protein